MAEVIRMPRMSDTMEEGVIAAWHKKVGDKVKAGDLLADVETDKATMELESYQDGTLLYIGVEQGQAVKVNGVLAIVGKEGEDYKPLLEKEGKAGPSANADAEKVKETVVPADQKEEPVGQKEGKQPVADTAQPNQAKEIQPPAETSDDNRVKASPLARSIAKEKGIDLSQLKGSGDEGRIVKRDVESYQPAAKPTKESQPAIQLPNVVGEESYDEIAVSQMRKTIARRLSESKFSAPHFYLTMEINMDNAMAAREGMNAFSEVKISFNDIVIKAVAATLRKHPKVNASWLGDKIRYNHHIHIGVAVAVEEGLLVPVIRFADNKPLSHIAAEVRELAGRAKDKKLQPQEMQGNTFTISNLGMFGIEEFTAIINPPDACILAVGGIKEVVVTDGNGGFKATHVMKVTLSCDHRVVDGATGAQFLQTLKSLLENPVRMLV
ncbi:MAG: pyruvate dehydrogenase complex dihydrolipoamide acetyltransferase [Chitinophagales bacterium]|nr:pyruvate dehydrogenase complex dihydrolipoamide acetyltransferase [Chitinophagales bacterium]